MRSRASVRKHKRRRPQCVDYCVGPFDPGPPSSADPLKAGIAEDAIAGVMAGRRGWFALVLGVDRNKSGVLGRNGANWVINDFSKISADEVIRFFTDRARAA